MDRAEASRTAVLVCQGRAVAHGGVTPDRFDDPTAMVLLRDPERAAVERVRAGVAPRALGERLEFEMVRASGEVMVPRTIAIDDALTARPTPQLVILGAGLDGRAWRLPSLAAVDVFEVDHPSSQHDKRDRATKLPPLAKSLRFVPVDFTRDELGASLATAGHRDSDDTTWIWEGVVPYLTKADVRATMRVLSRRSAPGSRLVINYQAPSLSATIGRLFARGAMTVVSRQSDPLAHEPRRGTWTPAAMRELLEAATWTVVSDDDLVTLAERLPIPIANRRSLRAGRVVVADRAS